MKTAGILGFPLILLCAGIAFGGDLSTLNPSVGAPARYLYSMARDGVLPRPLGALHPRYGTPHVAIAFLGVVTLLFVSTGSIIYIASLSLFADLLYYIIGFAAFVGLRRRFPHLPRPYRAPAGLTGALFSILVYLVMMAELPKDAFLTGAPLEPRGLGDLRPPAPEGRFLPGGPPANPSARPSLSHGTGTPGPAVSSMEGHHPGVLYRGAGSDGHAPF